MGWIFLDFVKNTEGEKKKKGKQLHSAQAFSRFESV